MSDEEIKKEYQRIQEDIASKIKFENIPPDPNFLRSAWDDVRPWGERPKPEYDITIDDVIFYKDPIPDQPHKQFEETIIIPSAPLLSKQKQQEKQKKISRDGGMFKGL